MIRKLTCLVLLTIFLCTSPTNTWASTRPLPTSIYQTINGGKVSSAAVPDFNQINLANIGQIISSGSIDERFNEKLGYDFSRTWQAGDSPAQFLKLGDIAPAMAPKEFAIGQIEKISGLDFAQIAMDNFSTLADQAIKELVEAVPYLGEFQVEDVAPIKSLVSSFAGFSGNTSDLEIGELVRNYPQVGSFTGADRPEPVCHHRYSQH